MKQFEINSSINFNFVSALYTSGSGCIVSYGIYLPDLHGSAHGPEKRNSPIFLEYALE